MLSIASIVYSQDLMFWGDQNSKTLNKLNIRSGETSVVAENQSVIRRVKVDHINKNVYWTAAHQGGVFRSDFDGGNPELVVQSNFNVSLLVLDEEHEVIYFSEYGAILKCNYDGTNLQRVVRNNGRIQGMDIDLSSNYIFWTDNTNKVLKRADLDGSKAATIFESPSALYDLVLDPGNEHIYFNDRTANKIQRIDYDGSNLTEILQVEGSIGSLGIDLELERLSWIEKSNGVIGMANLNGEEKTALVNIPISFISGQDFLLSKVQLPAAEVTPIDATFLLFPNPASTVVNIESATVPATTLTVYDSQGRLLFDKGITSSNTSVDCSQLDAGTYLFVFKDKEVRVGTKEVVIVKD